MEWHLGFLMPRLVHTLLSRGGVLPPGCHAHTQASLGASLGFPSGSHCAFGEQTAHRPLQDAHWASPPLWTVQLGPTAGPARLPSSPHGRVTAGRGGLFLQSVRFPCGHLIGWKW